MTLQNAFIPELVIKGGNKITHNVAVTLVGTALIALVAQISIALPFTPVPITGQTFGVALISLLWGRTRGFSAVAIYLCLGFSGLPVFAFGKAGILIGPTSGYLAGMLAASFIMGSLADCGWTKTFLHTWLAAFMGSAVVFLCGAMVLAFYIPKQYLFMQGVLPFIPGDVIKTFFACIIVRQISKTTGIK